MEDSEQSKNGERRRVGLTHLRSMKEGLNPPEIWRLVIDLLEQLEQHRPTQEQVYALTPASIDVIFEGQEYLTTIVHREDRSATGLSLFTAPEILTGGAVTPTTKVWLAARIGFWAAGPRVRPLVGEYLRDALEPDPTKRPAAEEIVASLEQEAAPAISPPPPATSEELPGVEPRRSSPRGEDAWREKYGRRSFQQMWMVGVFLGVAVATYATMSATSTWRESGLTIRQVQKLSEPSVSEIIQDLTSIRNHALTTHDGELLATVSVPGSGAAQSDRELFGSLRNSVPLGLTTQIEVRQSTHTRDSIVAETVLQQEAYSWSGGARDGTAVEALPPRCAEIELELYKDQWRVASVSACAAAVMSG